MTIKEQAIKWVQEYFAANGNENTKAIIGISGGKDSSTVAALCCAALGKERVIGVMMPNGVQSDIEDSKKLCDFLGIECYTINIEKSFNGITEEILTQTKNTEFNNQYKTNMPSRLRMATLYGIAALNGNASGVFYICISSQDSWTSVVQFFFLTIVPMAHARMAST